MPDVAAIRMQCFALLIPVIFLCSAGGAHAAIQCYQCHGSSGPPDYRPVDAPYRNVTSGGFSGNHRTHMGPDATASACAVCHPSAGYSSSHRNGRIDLAANINGSPLTAVYRNGSSGFGQTATPSPGSCTNVNCHFERATPTWGSAPLTAPGACGSCHGAPPSGGETGAAGSHALHDRYLPGTGGCAACHTDHLAEPRPFAHATSAGRRDLLITVRNPDASPAGFYSGPTNDYLPKSQGNQFGRCSGVYCHSNGTTVATGAVLGTFSSPVWGGSTSCNSCHSYPPAYANGSPKANAHPKHNYYNYSCSRCHYGTTSDGTGITNPATHANAAYDVAPPPGETLAYTASPTGGSCTTYCHSSAQGITDPTQPPTYASPSWSQQYGRGCQMCHAAGYHAQGVVPYLKSGSHEKHLVFEVGGGCGTCHYKPEYNDRPTCWQCHVVSVFDGHRNDSARGPEHADGKIDVALITTFPAAGATGSYTGDTVPGTPYGSCRDLYCHSRGTRLNPPYEPPISDNVRWGGSLPGDCTGCHGGDANSTAPLATGSHTSHIIYDCSGCHQATVTDSRTPIPAKSMAYYPIYTDKTKHANGSVDVALKPEHGGSYYGGAKSPGSAPTSCANTYCHTSGTSVATGSITGTANSPTWGSSSTPLTCSGCHGYPPAYEDTTPKANNHVSHSQFGCQACHFATTTNGTAIADQARHINKQYDLAAGAGVSFTYSYGAGGSSCSGVSCHSPGAAPRPWASTSCGNCHTASPDDPSHRKHFTGAPRHAAYGNMSSSPLFGFNCGICHPADPGLDNDGVVQVELYSETAAPGSRKALNSPLAHYSSGGTILQDSRGIAHTNGTCSNIYCHGDGTSVSTGQQPVSAALVWNGPAMTCSGCHGSPPSYANGSPKANSHQQHRATGCTSCHAGTTANGVSIADLSRHGDGRYDLSPGSGRAFTYAYAASGGNCTTISCHNDGTGVATGAAPSGLPGPTAWGTTMACTACHGSPPSYPSGAPKKNSHAKHGGTGCQTCHAATTADGASISDHGRHGNGAYDVTPAAGTSFSYTFAASGGSCSGVSCHGDGTTLATGTPRSPSSATWGTAACTICHGDPPAYGNGSPKANSHARHISWDGTTVRCYECHYDVMNTLYQITDPSKHNNGQYNVSAYPRYDYSFGYTFAPAGGSCSNVPCHSDGTAVPLGRAPVSPAVTWGGPPMTCASCHGYPPAYANGSPKANSHQGGHAPYACNTCHYWVTNDSVSITHRGYHPDNLYSADPGPGTTFSYSFSLNGGTCSTISCHSDGTAVRTGTRTSATAKWGAASSCTLCHGSPPSYTNGSPKSNSHMGNHAALGCQNCHYTVTADGKGIADQTLHKNGRYTIAPGPGVSFLNTSSNTRRCSNVTCHGDGTAVVTGAPRSTGTADWGSTLDCSGCHRDYYSWWRPEYPNGSPKANSHSTHVVANNLGCFVCHAAVVNSGYSIINAAKHKNGQYDVSPYYSNMAFSYTFATNADHSRGGTCTALYCHSNGTSVRTGAAVTASAIWGSPSLGCNSCHGYPPSYPSGSPKLNGHMGKHELYTCNRCHNVSTSGHANGYYDVSGGTGIKLTYSGSYSATCSNVSCHGDGTSIITGTAPVNGPLQWGATFAFGCDGCHGRPPAYADRSPKGNAHGSHAAYGCEVCHYPVVTDRDTISDRSRHANGFYNISGNGSATFTYSFGYLGSSCSNISCHADGAKRRNWSYQPFDLRYVSPADNATYVDGSYPVQLVFAEAMDMSTVNDSTFYVTENGTPAPGTYSGVAVDQNCYVISFTPSLPLHYFTTYTATFTNGIRTAVGANVSTGRSWSFTTGHSPQYGPILTQQFSANYGSIDPFTVARGTWNPASLGRSYMSDMYAIAYEQWGDSILQTPVLNLSAYKTVELRFAYYLQYTAPNTADVDLSLNGSAGPWTTVWTRSNPPSPASTEGSYAITVNLSPYLRNQPDLSRAVIRFRFNVTQIPQVNSGAFAVDNIYLYADPN